MNYKKACDILNLNKTFDIEILKRQYRKYALIYHPDKNVNDKSTFYDIKEAYEYLLNYKTNDVDYLNENLNSTSSGSGSENANIILYEFLRYLNVSIDTNKLIEIINHFNNNKIHSINSILKTIKYEYLIEIHEIITKYKKFLNINNDFIILIEDAIKSRFKNYIILHPSLEDIYKANIYKLVYNNETYYVPLWHSEIYYRDINNDPLIVKCIPKLDDNIYIDEKSNLHIKHKIKINDLLDIDFIEHEFLYKIPIEKLRIKENQIIKLHKKGVPCINIKDIYNAKNKNNIYVYVELLKTA